VGPQRYKLGVSQAFPWPTKLSAGEDAAAERAKAAARMVDANVLSVRKSVAEVYWTLWLIDEEHRLKTEHDAVLESLAGAVRGRLQIGAASLADLNLVDLNIARHHDHKGRHEQAARKASARLRAMIGAQAGNEVLSVSGSPKSGLPVASESALAELAALHPLIERFTHLATSEEHVARAQRADRFPKLKIGLDIIGTGDAAMAGVEDSGKDAVVLSAALSIPLWAGSYSDATDAAYANRNAHEAMREAGKRQLEAMLGIALSNVRDAQRRIELYEKTLVPQAEATFQAVLGGYQTGRSTVATVILAQRDLSDLHIEYAGARADHAKFWVALEFAAGTQLVTKGKSND
jgi:outer membrane protein TolC